MEIDRNITDLSHELLCEILKYLPLRETLAVAMLCKKMSSAVDMHLRLCKSIDFCQNAICGYMPSTITDDHLLTLLKKCPHLETVYGLHPIKIERRRLRKRSALTIPGIIEALSLCIHLKAIETSDLRLFEAIMQHLPQLEIIGHFQNRDGLFPPQASQRLKLQPYPRISSLHLIGVEVPELTAMPHLQHLHLQCVRFTKLQPFRAFLAQNLKSFVMKHCIGPSVPQRYLSLIIALSSSPNLSHLELVRVPLLNGLFQRAVEDSYRHNGFVNLRTLVIAGCKGILEADLGHLMIVASKNLETLYIQPSLTKDSLFVSLSYAQCSFPRLQNLHLGYVDNLNSSGEWSNDALLSFGLAEVPDTPSSITDSGMKVISQLFPCIKTLCVSNCPHLMVMYQWMPSEDLEGWSKLTDLTLQKCHCLQLSSFALFISFLRNIQVVILHDMFREPPKGCSHVGLSAGTGLGMSSAVVSNQDEHIAVQGHQQDFEHPGDEENEENEREFVDVENEDNPEPQFMVLQRDFFDGDDDDGADGDVPLEEIQDLEHNEEHNNAENLPHKNSASNEHAVDKTNNDHQFSKPVPIEKYEDGSSTSFVSHDQNIDGSRYNLRKSYKKSSKSVYVQCNSSDLNEGKNTINNEEMSKDDKGIAAAGVLDSDYVQEYDPHKPSTSKAGRHLDFSVAHDTKPCDVYDSESDLDYSVTYDTKPCHLYDSDSESDYKYGSTSKQLKKSNKQSFSKKIKGPKLAKLTYNNSSKDNNVQKNVNVNDSTKAKTYIYSNNINSPSNEDVKLNGLCRNSITKHQEEKLLNKSSKNYSKISNVKSEPEMHLSCKTESVEDDQSNKISTMNELKNSCTLKQKSNDFTGNNCLNSNEEELYKIPVLKKSESEFEICIQNAHKDTEQSISLVNNTKNEKGSENGILDANENSSETVSYHDCPYEIISEDKKIMPKKDRHSKTHVYDSVIKSENENTESRNFNSFSLTSNSQIKDSVTNTLSFKHENEIHSGISHNFPEKISESSGIYSISNSKSFSDDSCNNLCKEAKTVLNNYDQNTTLKTEVRMNDSVNTDLVQSDMSKPIIVPENEAVVDDINSNSLYVNMEDCKSEIPDHVEANKNVITKFELPLEDVNVSCKMKPCSVVLTKIDEILPYAEINCNSHNEASINKTNSQEKTSSEKNFSIKNENSRIHNSCQPSTSNSKIDIHNKCPRKSLRYVKRTQPHKQVNTKSNQEYSLPSSRDLKNEIGDANEIELQSIKNGDDDSCENNSLKDLQPPIKRKKSSDNHKDEYNCYAIVSNTSRSFEIMNSSTGNSYRIPSCRISVSQINSESCNVHLKSKVKGNHKSNALEKVSDKLSKRNSGYNSCLPSTSKSKSNTNKISNGQCSVQCNSDANLRITRSATSLSQKYPLNDRSVKNMPNITKSEKSMKKSSKSCCFEVSQTDKYFANSLSVEKLKITNSDAALLIKKYHTEENNRLNSYKESKCHAYNNTTNKQGAFINSNSKKGVKQKSVEARNCSSAYQENNDPPLSPEKEIKSGMNTGKRKRKFTKSKKGRKKGKLSLKSSSNRHSSRNTCSRPLPGPMISLVSQGTQATSADIRRSVRRIRRATARTRRAVSSLHISRSSSHPSKISAKMLHKVPKSSYSHAKVPHPETQDKATSTSDPLLEEDAIQTLVLASDTLLSFTVVSCGISDLIINRCPKLFHVEVQACRILKKLELNTCPAMKKLNVSQCPKLTICALVTAVLSLSTDSYFLTSYEPCMQGYHPGDGEKAILSRVAVNQSVLICHDFSDVSCDGIQAKFREKLIMWLRYLSNLHFSLNYVPVKWKRKIHANGIFQCPIYPWSHDIQKMYGHYTFPPQSDFCTSEGQYQLVTNNPIFRDIFETRQIDTGFPALNDCDAYKVDTLLSCEAIEKYLLMKKNFVGFYIPITDSNQMNFYK